MNKLDKESVTAISALLVHAANIDEIYTNHEKDLIKNFIKSYLDNEDANKILNEAEKIESNSNQLLNFTNIIKKNSVTHLLNFSALKHVRSEEEIDSVKYMLSTNSDRFFNFKRNEKNSLKILETKAKNFFPSYMRPSKIFILKKLPYNESGKFDEKSLKKLI